MKVKTYITLLPAQSRSEEVEVSLFILCVRSYRGFDKATFKKDIGKLVLYQEIKKINRLTIHNWKLILLSNQKLDPNQYQK